MDFQPELIHLPTYLPTRLDLFEWEGLTGHISGNDFHTEHTAGSLAELTNHRSLGSALVCLDGTRNLYFYSCQEGLDLRNKLVFFPSLAILDFSPCPFPTPETPTQWVWD